MLLDSGNGPIIVANSQRAPPTWSPNGRSMNWPMTWKRKLTGWTLKIRRPK